MNALLSAVASDLVGRLVSFLIGRYRERGAAYTAVRLQRALLRARVVVEEAGGRQIANRAMLQQLNQLRRELCRAAYALDAFRWRDRRSRSHARHASSSDCSNVLSVSVESLESALTDMREFVVLLVTCPRITRQPYSTYLFMETCMFGRQVEKEQIIGFLSQPSYQDLDVLPIIGPNGVGKRTLVEHVCLDERVRERFAKIHRLGTDELDSHHEHHWSVFDFTASFLMVIDIVDGDSNAAEAWRRFHSELRRRAHRGSKIVVISRTEAHASLGSVPALRLHPPRPEELWHFFRTLAFGATNPEDRPDLARVAMALCEGVCEFAPFAAVNVVAASLRADQSARSWRRVRKVYAEATVLQQLGAAGDGVDEDGAGYYYLCRPVKDAPEAPCLFYNRRKLTGVAGSELPKVTMLELLAGGSLPPAGEARFEVLMWQSRIPPHETYVATCDVERARLVVAGEKQDRKRRRDGCALLELND
jgi:hypothetical protein